MLWYEEVLDRIDIKKIYSHKELIDELKILKPDLSESTYHWAVSGLVRKGVLTRLGYDSYSLSSDLPKDEYMPVYSDTPHTIMLEKMLVDMSADKLIAATFSKAELPDVYERAQSRYLLDKVRMLRYARRRNRQEVLLKYLEGSKVEDATS